MHSQPLISCIMPTYNRQVFIPQAIVYFLRQDYPTSELICVDDGTEPIQALVPTDDGIRYVRVSTRMTVGTKRNLACTQAYSDVIAHWDDDAWHAPHRLWDQIGALPEAGAEVCAITARCMASPCCGSMTCKPGEPGTIPGRPGSHHGCRSHIVSW